jgi:hypothetical protein
MVGFPSTTWFTFDSFRMLVTFPRHCTWFTIDSIQMLVAFSPSVCTYGLPLIPSDVGYFPPRTCTWLPVIPSGVGCFSPYLAWFTIDSAECWLLFSVSGLVHHWFRMLVSPVSCLVHHWFLQNVGLHFSSICNTFHHWFFRMLVLTFLLYCTWFIDSFQMLGALQHLYLVFSDSFRMLVCFPVSVPGSSWFLQGWLLYNLSYLVHHWFLQMLKLLSSICTWFTIDSFRMLVAFQHIFRFHHWFLQGVGCFSFQYL